MHLFLASRIEQTMHSLVKAFSLIPEDTPTLYIPTAGNCYNPPPLLEERGSYQACIKHGFPVSILDIETETPHSLKAKKLHPRLILVAGGNTYYLLFHLRRSGFAHIIPDLLSQGTIYAGSSAGSCVCSPTIQYIQEQDDPRAAPELTDYTGLGLIDFNIYPHCIEEYAKLNYSDSFIKDMLRSSHKKIMLKDHQAVVVQDTFYRIISQDTQQSDMS